MIVDTSALVAILFDEPRRLELLELLGNASSIGISAANLVELSIVVTSRGSGTSHRHADRLRADLGIVTIPVTEAQAEIARAAYRDFGRGSGHPAKLNFGDCFAYAAAIDRDEPLLWVGSDFGHTDVRAVLAPQG